MVLALGGGGGGRGQTANEAEQSETFAEFAKTNDMIGMVVGTRNGGYYVKAGEIVLAINGQTGSTIKLHADVIDIQGIINALQVESITVRGIHADQATIDNTLDVTGAVEFSAGLTLFNGFHFSGGNFEIEGNNASWKSQSVITSVSVTKTSSYGWVYENSAGVQHTYQSQMVTDVGKSSTTIHYLGY